MIQNRLLSNFLANKNTNKLYLSYLEQPTTHKKYTLEKLFQIHVRKVQLLSYFSKVLHFESQKYDKKIRHVNSVNQLILDKNVNDGGSHFRDLIGSERPFDEFKFATPIGSEDLELVFEDKQLYEIVSKLSAKQKEVIYLIFVEDLTEDEVAQRLVITKQAVNKTKNQVLRKIKRDYKSEKRGVM